MDSKSIARKALEIGAIKLDTQNFFRDKGIYKPIFDDAGSLLFNSVERKNIKDAFIEQLNYDYGALASVASFGASISTSIADYLEKPFIFLRNSQENYRKRFHLDNLEAIRKLKGKRVVIIDERLGQGSFILRATCALRECGFISDKFHSIFDYGCKSIKEVFSGKIPFNRTKLSPPLEVRSLFDLDTLLEVALENGYINSEGREDILLWRDDYHKWNAAHSSLISPYP